jgi:uncharacterized protein
VIEVRSSPIHGRGVFATKPIPEGEFIGEYEGTETQRNDTHVLWIYSENREVWVGIDGTNDLKYLNHSKAPNCHFIGPDLFASRDIEPGEELTFDYGKDWEGGVVNPMRDIGNKRRFKISFQVDVELAIEPDLIEEVLKPDWRDTFYEDIREPIDVASHLAYNLIRGASLKQLDGFAHREETDVMLLSDEWTFDVGEDDGLPEADSGSEGGEGASGSGD